MLWLGSHLAQCNDSVGIYGPHPEQLAVGKIQRIQLHTEMHTDWANANERNNQDNLRTKTAHLERIYAIVFVGTEWREGA